MKYIRAKLAVPLVAAALAAACTVEPKKTDTLAQDSTLNRDIQLANRDSAVQPQLQDVPAANAPASAPAPAPVAPAPVRRSPVTSPPVTHRTTVTRAEPRPTTVHNAPAPAPTTTASGNTVTRNSGAGAAATHTGSIAAGTTINLTSNSRVCTNTDHVGDRVTATVANAVSGSNGVVIPAGATASLEITELKRSENINDKIVMGFRVHSISFGGKTYPVEATVNYAQVDRVKNEPTGKDVQKVATGAAVGAIVGKILGKSTKATVIGGAVGAAAGAGAAATTSNYEGCVPDGGRITVALQSPVQVQG